VRSGDTLWDVAAALLGSDASDAQIAAEVRRLYRLNADVLASPDALVPGVQLRLS
jgi:nucleoid-associated protein YgaU